MGAPATLCLTFDNMGQTPDLVRGYPRVLALLDELGLKATFFIEGWNGLHHPERVLELAARGHEVGLHGWVHEKFSALSRLQAEQVLHDGTACFARLGLRPAGFRAPGGLRGSHALPILRTLGYRYDSSTESLSDDDDRQPARLAPDLAHIPWRPSMVDSIHYLRRGRPPEELEEIWLRGIDRVAAGGGNATIVIHAYVSGVDDGRFAVMRKVLTHARRRGDIEIITAGALAERVLASAT